MPGRRGGSWLECWWKAGEAWGKRHIACLVPGVYQLCLLRRSQNLTLHLNCFLKHSLSRSLWHFWKVVGTLGGGVIDVMLYSSPISLFASLSLWNETNGPPLLHVPVWWAECGLSLWNTEPKQTFLILNEPTSGIGQKYGKLTRKKCLPEDQWENLLRLAWAVGGKGNEGGFLMKSEPQAQHRSPFPAIVLIKVVHTYGYGWTKQWRVQNDHYLEGVLLGTRENFWGLSHWIWLFPARLAYQENLFSVTIDSMLVFMYLCFYFSHSSKGELYT